jgi:hypothetical protein
VVLVLLVLVVLVLLVLLALVLLCHPLKLACVHRRPLLLSRL